MVVWTTLRTERPAMPVVSVPGSPPTGEADQVPTQTPEEAGAAELCGARAPERVVVLLSPLPWSEATPTYMAADRTTIRAMIVLSSA
ncbi:hypothetical protein SALBM311S_02975 [Streptomyces alboniger]